MALLSAADASFVERSEILNHHPLNTSDHLPVKINIKWSTEGNDTSVPQRKTVSWNKVLEEGLTTE